MIGKRKKKVVARPGLVGERTLREIWLLLTMYRRCTSQLLVIHGSEEGIAGAHGGSR